MTVRRALAPAIAMAAGSVVAIGAAVLTIRVGPSAHAAATPFAATVTLLAVVVLLTAAGVGCVVERLSTSGALCAAILVAWLAPVWVGWYAGPSWLRIVAAGMAFLLTPFLVHLLLLPLAGGQARARRAVVTCAYGLSVGLALGIAATRDPFRDTRCWNDCNIVGAPLASQTVATALVTAASLVEVIAGVGALAWWAWQAGDPPDREWSIAITGSAAVALAATATDGMLRLVGLRESASSGPFSASHLIGAASLVLVGGGVLWVAGTAGRRRRAVRRLSESLSDAPAPGTLEAALREAIGDPGMRVAYWLPHTQRFVDAAGRSVHPGAGAVAVRRDDDVLAMITLDRPTTDAPALVEEIGAAARLTIDNERLLAESAAQLAELTASQRRIVDAADGTRHRIERDLHDGAQAGLVAALFELSVAEADDPRIGQLTKRGRAIAAELRELTHGVYPSALDDFGLEEALRSLLDSAQHPVHLEFSLAVRPDPSTERAVFAVVRRLLSVNALSAVSVDPVGAHVRVRLTGPIADADLRYAKDRLGAVGGSLARRGDGVVATMPARAISRSAPTDDS